LWEFCAAYFFPRENCQNYAPDKFQKQKIAGFSPQLAEKE
jgi:hypothetical protein